MSNKRGILLIAGGHPFYGNMARNFALGIKQYSNIEIALFHDGRGIAHLTEEDKKLFTLYDLPESTYKSAVGINSYLRAKTHIYDISPFTETIYFDVDLIWHPNRRVDELFDSLKDYDFSMTNEGHINLGTAENALAHKYHFWAKPDEVKRAYSSEKAIKDALLYQFRSEFIYFKKTAENKKYFTLAKKIYDNPRATSTMFGSVLPDETAFTIASALQHHYPHKSVYSPVYWDYLYSFMRLERGPLFKTFYASSMGGKMVKTVQKKLYDDLVKKYYNESGRNYTSAFYWLDKREFDKQRKEI